MHWLRPGQLRRHGWSLLVHPMCSRLSNFVGKFYELHILWSRHLRRLRGQGRLLGKHTSIDSSIDTSIELQSALSSNLCADHWVSQVCPDNTVSILRSSSVDACTCEPGFYHPTGAFGLNCTACPTGAVCLGGGALPYPQPGYFQVLTARSLNAWVLSLCVL